jgi:hypothetical protein
MRIPYVVVDRQYLVLIDHNVYAIVIGLYQSNAALRKTVITSPAEIGRAHV